MRLGDLKVIVSRHPGTALTPPDSMVQVNNGVFKQHPAALKISFADRLKSNQASITQAFSFGVIKRLIHATCFKINVGQEGRAFPQISTAVSFFSGGAETGGPLFLCFCASPRPEGGIGP